MHIALHNERNDMSLQKSIETCRAGVIYQHKKTGNLYTVEAVLPIKLDGEWRQNGAVIYSNDSGDMYARLLHDFMAAFDFVAEK